MAQSFVLKRDLGALKTGTVLSRRGRWYVNGTASFEASSVERNGKFFEPLREDFQLGFATPAEAVVSA